MREQTTKVETGGLRVNLIIIAKMLNSFIVSNDFCHLLITFANSLDPDQDRQNASKPFDILNVFLM